MLETKSILVFDGSEGERQRLQVALEGYGGTAISAPDLMTACDAVDGFTPDAIVAFLSTSKQDSLAFIGWIEQQHPDLVRKTAIVTAMPQIVVDRVASAFNNVIYEPYDDEDLLACIAGIAIG